MAGRSLMQTLKVLWTSSEPWGACNRWLYQHALPADMWIALWPWPRSYTRVPIRYVTLTITMLHALKHS